MSERKFGVELERPAEMLQGFFMTTRHRAAQAVPAQLVGLPGFGVVRRQGAGSSGVLDRKRGLQGVRDGGRYFGLGRENIRRGQLSTLDFGPQMTFVGSNAQLDIDAHTVTRPLHSAFDHRRDAELFSYVANRQLGSAKLLNGSPGDDGR